MLNIENQLPAYYPERRRHVRVRDALGLRVQRLGDLPANGHLQGKATIIAADNISDSSSVEGYSRVQNEFPAVAEHIHDLEERVRQLLLARSTEPTLPTHKVSLSEGGLNFTERMLFLPGEKVHIELTLFPLGQRISADAVIISANDSDDVSTSDQPTYHAKFIRISDADHKLLASHVDHLLSTCSFLDYTL